MSRRSALHCSTHSPFGSAHAPAFFAPEPLMPRLTPAAAPFVASGVAFLTLLTPPPPLAAAPSPGAAPPTTRTGAALPADQPGALPGEAPAHVQQVVALPQRPVATSRRSGSTPMNAAYTNGLYTVQKVGNGIYYRKGQVLGVGINVIEADLNDPEVRVAAMLARGGIGSQEGFGNMVRRARPAAAITGTFFGIRNLYPTGDLVINGQAVFRGFIGTAVAITDGNVVSFIPTRYKDQSVDWSLFDTVIRGGPRLVLAGNVEMTARSEGFRSLPISARRTRTAVALTRDNRLQFVAVRQGITLWELAKVMRAIGAYHAVALDGGTSTAMYFAGQYIAKPGRGLTNVMMIYHSRDRYEAMRGQFAGAAYHAATPSPSSSVPAPAAVTAPIPALP